jgi:hypothetical protein
MAKKTQIGTIQFYKRTKKKRPGRHRKNYGPKTTRPKKYRGQGR